jgi:hypothetical protein
VPHCELAVQALEQVPVTPPVQTCDFPQSLELLHVDAVQPDDRQSSLPQ